MTLFRPALPCWKIDPIGLHKIVKTHSSSKWTWIKLIRLFLSHPPTCAPKYRIENVSNCQSAAPQEKESIIIVVVMMIVMLRYNDIIIIIITLY